MFYAFIEEEAVLVFTSDPASRHIIEAIKNQNVAGAIALETKVVWMIRGVQFNGIIIDSTVWEGKRKAHHAYFKRFPYTVLNPFPLWILELHNVKFTDNSLGFGKKLRWSRVRASTSELLPPHSTSPM